MLEAKLITLRGMIIAPGPETISEKRFHRISSFGEFGRGHDNEERSTKISHSASAINLSHKNSLPPALAESQRKELEEQLADALYKRAQAKLLVEADTINIEAALSDALKAISYLRNEDDDYQLVVATCYIRLKRYTDAVNVLEDILKRAPNNSKALYNLSFCRRAAGDQKDAIEGLTKVLNWYLICICAC